MGNSIVTRADVHYVNWDGKLALVILCDFSGGTGSAGDSAGRFSGHSAKKGEGRVDWRWETLDGKSGAVVINGQSYDRAKGGLFLVYTKAAQPRVVQRDHAFTGDEATLDDLAANDPDMKQFVAEAAEP